MKKSALLLLASVLIYCNFPTRAYPQTVESVLRGVQERKLAKYVSSGYDSPARWHRVGEVAIEPFPEDGALTSLDQILYALNIASEHADALRKDFVCYDSDKKRPVEYRHEAKNSYREGRYGVVTEKSWDRAGQLLSYSGQMYDDPLDYIRVGVNGDDENIVIVDSRNAGGVYPSPYPGELNPDIPPEGKIGIVVDDFSGSRIELKPIFLQSVGRFDESNWKWKLRLLASNLDQMRALPWPATYDATYLAGISYAPESLIPEDELLWDYEIFPYTRRSSERANFYLAKRSIIGANVIGLYSAFVGGAFDVNGNTGRDYNDLNDNDERDDPSPYSSSTSESALENSGEGLAVLNMNQTPASWGFATVVGGRMSFDAAHLPSEWGSAAESYRNRMKAGWKAAMFQYPIISFMGDTSEEVSNINKDRQRIAVGQLRKVPLQISGNGTFDYGQLDLPQTDLDNDIFYLDTKSVQGFAEQFFGLDLSYTSSRERVEIPLVQSAVDNFLDYWGDNSPDVPPNESAPGLVKLYWDAQTLLTGGARKRFATVVGGHSTFKHHVPPDAVAFLEPAEVGNRVSSVEVNPFTGTTYSTTPMVRIDPPPNGRTAEATAILDDDGYVVSVQVSDPGSGYTDTPLVYISPPNDFPILVDSDYRIPTNQFLNAAIGLCSIALPNFTTILPPAAKIATPVDTIGAVQFEIENTDLFRIYVGRGKSDQNQGGWIAGRPDGFGSLQFLGPCSYSEFELHYEMDPEKFEAPVNNDRTFQSGVVFTSSQSENSGFPDHNSYIAKWFEPRLRQIRSADVIADITYVTAYKKIIRLYWAHDIVPLGEDELYLLDEAEAFKTLTLENEFTAPGSGLATKVPLEDLLMPGADVGLRILESWDGPPRTYWMRHKIATGSGSKTSNFAFAVEASGVKKIFKYSIPRDPFSEKWTGTAVHQENNSEYTLFTEEGFIYPKSLTERGIDFWPTSIERKIGDKIYKTNLVYENDRVSDPMAVRFPVKEATIDIDGAIRQYTRENQPGRLPKETFKQRILGKEFQVEKIHTPDGLTTVVSIDGSSLSPHSKAWNVGTTTEHSSTGDGYSTTTKFWPGDSAIETPWTQQTVTVPGGGVYETSIVGNAFGMVSKSEFKWGPRVVERSTTTFNRLGGFVSRNRYSQGALVEDTTSSEHTPWGAPSKLTDIQGKTTEVEYERVGPFYGSVTSLKGDGRQLGFGIDRLGRLNSHSGADSFSVSYPTPWSVATDYGAYTQTTETSPSGELKLLSSTLGEGFAFDGDEISVGLRKAGVSFDKQTGVISAINSGLGAPGARQEFGVENGKLFTETYTSNGGFEYPPVKTIFDGLGRPLERSYVAADNSPAKEMWEYDDDKRSVTFMPGVGPVAQSVTSTLSSDGSVLTVATGGRDSIRHTYAGTQIKTEIKDDSTGTDAYVEVQRTVDYLTLGETTVVPWAMSGAMKTIERKSGIESGLPSALSSRSVARDNVTLDTSTANFTNGKLSSISVTQGGVGAGLVPRYVNGVVKSVDVAVGPQSHTVEFDTKLLVSKATGPGYDKTFTHAPAGSYDTASTDSIQGVSTRTRAAEDGHFLSSIDGASVPISVNRVPSATGATSTINQSLVVEETNGSAMIRKDYPGNFSEIFGVSSDGTAKSWSVSSPEGSVSATFTQTSTSNNVSYSDGTSHNTSYYYSGPRKSVQAPNDHRQFVWEHMALKTESHIAGPLAGSSVTIDRDSVKGLLDKITVSRNGVSRVFSYGHDNYARLNKSRALGAGGEFVSTVVSRDGLGRLGDVEQGVITQGRNYDPTLPRLLGTTVQSGGVNVVSYGYSHDARHRISGRTSTRSAAWTGISYSPEQSALNTLAITGGDSFLYNYNARGNRIANVKEDNVPNSLDRIQSRTLLNRRGFVLGGRVASDNVQVATRHQYTGTADWLDLTVTPNRSFKQNWDVPLTDNGGNAVFVGAQLRATRAGSLTAVRKLELTVPPTSTTFTYAAGGRVKTDGVWLYTWDAPGRLISRERLPEARPPSMTSDVFDYTYDGDGRRTSKKRTVVQDGVTRTEQSVFLWAGWLLVKEERVVNGQALNDRWFQWGADISGTLEGAGGIGGLVAIHEENVVTHAVVRTLVPVHDGLGNITAVFNQLDGKMVAEYEYGPYGEPLGESGEGDACPFRWQTKWHESESGQYYFGYRYYDPPTGRWLSRDPLGEAGGFNLYAYCGGDPINRHDPLGLDWDDSMDFDEICDSPLYGGKLFYNDAHVLWPGGSAREYVGAVRQDGWVDLGNGRITSMTAIMEECNGVNTNFAKFALDSTKTLPMEALSGEWNTGASLAGSLTKWKSRLSPDGELTPEVFDEARMGASQIKGMVELGAGQYIPGMAFAPTLAKSMAGVRFTSAAAKSSLRFKEPAIQGVPRGLIGAKPGGPINPNGSDKNCVAGVIAVLHNKSGGRGARDYLVASGQAGAVGRFPKLDKAIVNSTINPGNVLKLINETTGFQHLRKIQGTFDAANESGHYVVFSPYHIIYGRVLPDGSRFLYDPQIHRVLQNWDEAMIVLRSKTPEIHLLTLPK